MDRNLDGLRHRLFLALGLVAGTTLGSSCLDTAPIDECFDVADEEYDDEVEVFTLDVGQYGECPSERHRSVKEAAQDYADSCMAGGAKLRYVACGPLEDRADYFGTCEYVAVFDKPVDLDQCVSIGRPFLVHAAPRLASAYARSDWALDRAIERPADERLAARLAAHWTAIALAEHASVAAFARFALQLMSIAAPPELLRACQAAMVDETRHAQLAFGLASRFGDAPVGPGPLELDGALADPSIEAILRDVVLEGCFGETRAAAEARAAASACEQPEVRAVLERIAEDEERHAALAWRFVGWLLAHRPALAPAFERAIGQGLVAAFERETEDDLEGGRAWGLLDRSARRRIDAQTRASIVAPLARALMARFAKPWTELARDRVA
jgi:hypothetical protein